MHDLFGHQGWEAGLPRLPACYCVVQRLAKMQDSGVLYSTCSSFSYAGDALAHSGVVLKLLYTCR